MHPHTPSIFRVRISLRWHFVNSSLPERHYNVASSIQLLAHTFSPSVLPTFNNGPSCLAVEFLLHYTKEAAVVAFELIWGSSEVTSTKDPFHSGYLLYGTGIDFESNSLRCFHFGSLLRFWNRFGLFRGKLHSPPQGGVQQLYGPIVCTLQLSEVVLQGMNRDVQRCTLSTEVLTLFRLQTGWLELNTQVHSFMGTNTAVLTFDW